MNKKRVEFPKQNKWICLFYNISFIQIYKNSLALKKKLHKLCIKFEL